MRKGMKVIAAAGLLALSLAFFGCASTDGASDQESAKSEPTSETPATAAADADADASGEEVELQILAANSLTKAMAEAQELYTQQHPNVTFGDTQYEASGTLNEMLGAGQYADILITASKGTMDDAVEAGYVKSDTNRTMFTNQLVVVTKEGGDLAKIGRAHV